MHKLLLALTAATMAATMMSCDVCGLIQQQIIVAADDPDLAGLVADCKNGVSPPAGSTCVPSSAPGAKINCACLPLCQRVFEIVYPDPHRPSLEGCAASVDAQGGARINIEYRSICR
jgi:hypothetical protein